jgi:hypothetical protein
VTKLISRGSGSVALIYSTYLGRSREDVGTSIAIDGSGNAYITGYTHSSDFPIVNEYQADPDADPVYPTYDAFVTELTYDGTGTVSLAYSTYLGGNGYDDRGTGIAVDENGNTYVTGSTDSDNFPTINQYQTDQGDYDVFVTKLFHGDSGNVSLVYSTYLGGSGRDEVFDIAIDGSGNAYVTGETASQDFPTLHEYQTDQSESSWEAFVTKLVHTGTGNVSLAYSTYLGGDRDDAGTGIAVDGSGNAYVIGTTRSTNFPTLNQYQTNSDSLKNDAFVTKLVYDGSTTLSLAYSTYLGGNRPDYGYDIAVDGRGSVYVTGFTESTDFPMLHPYQGNKKMYRDVFLTQLVQRSDGSLLPAYSTYFGGNDDDYGTGIAVDDSGNVYITGNTASTNFPILHQLQTYQGFEDAFVAKFDLGSELDVPVRPVGSIPGNHTVSPNPVHGSMQVAFALATAATVRMEIYTSDGRLVRVPVNSHRLEVGSHSQSITVDDLPPGLYTLRVMAGADSFAEQFVIMR